jgi:hypothetical protein
LEKDVIDKFQSDFKLVAETLHQLRVDRMLNKHTIDSTTLDHVEEMLQLLDSACKDTRFEAVYNGPGGKEIKNMCDVIDKLEAVGEERGIKEGEKKVYTECTLICVRMA